LLGSVGGREARGKEKEKSHEVQTYSLLKAQSMGGKKRCNAKKKEKKKGKETRWRRAELFPN